jgi:hypothetical protein
MFLGGAEACCLRLYRRFLALLMANAVGCLPYIYPSIVLDSKPFVAQSGNVPGPGKTLASSAVWVIHMPGSGQGGTC